jgi:hypothetical protein
MASDRPRLRAAIEDSRLGAVSEWLSGADASADDGGSRFAALLTESWLYRWLTTEPEPAVIVIDLRETRTVGPVLALLDRLLEWATPYWRQSRLHDGVIALERAGERVAATRAGQLLARLLVPPDPPTDDERRE